HRRYQPEDGLEQCGLAHAVGPEDGHELARADRGGHPGPDGTPTERDRRVPYLDQRGTGRGEDRYRVGHRCHRGHFALAWARACFSAVSWATCQSWKVAPAGVRVSVIVVTGM